MRYNNKVKYLTSRAAALMLALALVLSSVLPAAEIRSYAVTDNSGTASSAQDSAQDSSAQKGSLKTTTITNYQTSYNKRRNQTLYIAADITPADGREVQLQRYNSTDKTWTTITTVNAVAEPAAETEAATGTEQTAGTEAVTSTEQAATEEKSETPESDTVEVGLNVPSEERMKTYSTWRIYVPATDKATAATSENINITTRNIEKPDLSARNACIYKITPDGKGYMIYSKHSCTEVAQASTTKLMTAIVLMESGLIDSTTKISAHAASTPYASGRLAVGDVYKTRDLLYAMLLPSSNDAATAVAERVGGSEAGFVNMMNAKAEKMGFTKTHFRNPHGLDADGHYTTALELAELTAYAYTFPEIRDCWATQYKTIKSLEKGRKWTMWSTNAIFSYVTNFLGGKTGTEGNARCCFTGVYTHGGSTYVTVVLGSGYGFSRWSDTKKLHKYIQDYAESRY